MINIDTIMQYCGSLSTLHDLSKSDDAKRYVTDSQILAVNFDRVKEEYFLHMADKLNFAHFHEKPKSTDNCPKSPDALYISADNEIYFIECKVSNKPSPNNVRIKALEGLLMFMDITQTDRHFARNHITYIVASGEQPAQEYNVQMAEHVSKRADEPNAPVRFNMARFKGIYFKDILTLDSYSFNNFICENGWTSMSYPM